MNKYARIPEQIIDLHGCTLKEVEAVLAQLLLHRAYTHVRLIVGKGTHSKGRALVRDFTKEYLLTHNVRFAQSKLSEGGEGAIEVFLVE
jgi:DNA-nicking Smr family endonuclease